MEEIFCNTDLTPEIVRGALFGDTTLSGDFGKGREVLVGFKCKWAVRLRRSRGSREGFMERLPFSIGFWGLNNEYIDAKLSSSNPNIVFLHLYFTLFQFFMKCNHRLFLS